MLKETKTEEAIGCLVTFLSLVAFQLRGGPGFAYDYKFNAICDITILCAFLLGFPRVYIKATLMVLFCMINSNNSVK